MNRFVKFATILGAASALAAGPLSAQLLSSGVGNMTTFRTPFFGPGQQVTVANTVTLSSIGFWAGLPQGGTVDFMIWDGTDSNLLFSTQELFGSTADNTLILSNPISFSLLGGNSYYFGIFANGNLDVSYFNTVLNSCSNGLCFNGVNSNYTGSFATPVPEDGGGASIALELNGLPTATTPEPGTMAMLAFGLTGIAGAQLRRRRRA